MRNYFKVLGWVLLTTIFFTSAIVSIVGLFRAITGDNFPNWILLTCTTINLLGLSAVIYHDKYHQQG